MAEQKRILVVDDDEGWLVIIKAILEKEYDLTVTSDSSKAEGYLRAGSYALVILDMRLKGETGVEVLRRFRAVKPNLRAIIFTGYPDVETAVESMKIGALDYVKKVVSPEELRRRVREALDKAISDLIAQGENQVLEFKAAARWDIRLKKVNKAIEKAIAKTVVGFMNAGEGGTLLIGVDDSGAIIGLQHDYKTLSKRQNSDGYENFLRTLFVKTCGNESSPLFQITFHQVEGKEVCQIDVKPSPKPIFVKDEGREHFYLRAGNSTRTLSMSEALEYSKHRWPTK